MLPEVEPSKKPRRILYVASGTGIVGAAAGALACVFLLPPRVRAVTITPPPEHVVERVVEHVPVVIEPAKPPPITDVQLLFTVGDQTYFELEREDLPKHAAPELVVDGFATVATAEVAPRNLPEELRDWKQRRVIVDGTCEAHFAGFAIVARVRGNAHDANEDLDDWTPKSVMDYGAPILAARLEGCSGTFARDAAIPGITVLYDTNEPDDLADRAMKKFETEEPVVAAQDAWQEGNDGKWYEASDAQLETHVLRHPRTGELWIVIHAYRYNGCGEVGGNVVAFYRAEPDGKLESVKVRASSLSRVTHVIDLEGDGDLELVGESSDGTSIENTEGGDVASRGATEFGCGC